MNKARIKMKLRRHQKLIQLIRFIYTALNRPQNLQRKVHLGNRKNKTIIYLIRPNSEDGIQGLMSLFIQTMRKIDYAVSKGYIPFIDFKNYKTQYYDGESNIWEFYFTQPSKLKIDEVYNSKNVILSGVSLIKNEDSTLFKKTIFTDKNMCLRCNRLIFTNISFSLEVDLIVKKYYHLLHIETCIGFYIRGTDYTKLKPSGEHIQPDIEVMIGKLHEFIIKYPKSKVFLVTEDFENYKKLYDEFGDLIQITDFDVFIENYSGTDFLSNSNILDKNTKKRGMDYLVKIILLSKCKYLISSITMGSIAAYAMNGNKYADSYIYDLGFYD